MCHLNGISRHTNIPSCPLVVWDKFKETTRSLDVT